MNPSLKPFRINIGFLINQPIGYSRALPIELDRIDISGDILLKNVRGSINLSRMQDGVRAEAVFDGELESECGRCLEPFIDTIHSEFEEIFLFPNIETSEDEMQIPEDGNIDLEASFCDYMVMELPIAPVCKPDCKGLCDICGQDLNQLLCDHQKQLTAIMGAARTETDKPISGNQTTDTSKT